MRYGYWENWNYPVNPGPGTGTDPSYYTHDLKDVSHFSYAFLTLA